MARGPAPNPSLSRCGGYRDAVTTPAETGGAQLEALESPSSRSRGITLWRNSVSEAAVRTNGIGTTFPSASHPPQVAIACT
jgi:hypothetical protein